MATKDQSDALVDLVDPPARNPAPPLPKRPSTKLAPTTSDSTQNSSNTTESSLASITRRMSPKKNNPTLPNRQSVISSPVLQSTALPMMGVSRHPDLVPVDSTSSSSQLSSNLASPSSSSAPIALPPSTSFSSNSSRSQSSSAREMGFKERLVAGAGIGIDWGRKGKGKMVEGWKQSQSNGTNLNPISVGASFTKHFSNGSSTKLPAMILGVKVPRRSGMAFAIPLVDAVEHCRVPPITENESRIYDEQSEEERNDPVTGNEARRWLPAIVYRSLAFLNGAHADEEGLYRVNGGTHQIQQLRLLFDAGMDLDLVHFHASVVDPNLVASLLKSFLREVPGSLLSDALAPRIDALFVAALGYSATSSLGRHINTTTSTTNPIDLPCPPALLQHLAEIFKHELPAEYFHLLRAISAHLFHLTQLDSNKMSLSNLRLILSPTLRLSPGFLFYLIEERDVLFCEGNDDARRRNQIVQDIAAEKQWQEKLSEGGRRIRESKSMENLDEQRTGFFTRRPSIPPPTQFVQEEPEEEEEEDVTLEIVVQEETPAVRTPISDRFSGTTTSIRRLSVEQPPSPTSAEPKPNPVYHRAKGNESGFYVNTSLSTKKPPILPPRPVVPPVHLSPTPPSPSSTSRKLSLAEFDQYITHNSSGYSEESSSASLGAEGRSVAMGKAATWSKGGVRGDAASPALSLPSKLGGSAGI